MTNVLLVDDDHQVVELVADELAGRALAPVCVGSVAAATAALRCRSFAIVVLDLRLPDGSGLDVLQELRAMRSPAHVIVLSGIGTEADRIRALDRGADDYVVKPFSVRELGARVAAVRRRLAARDSAIRFGALTIDLGSREVTAGGERVDLTAKEFDVLAFLASSPRRVFTRAELLAAVWGSTPEWQQPATVTEHVRRLRLKLERDAGLPQVLHTVRGVGYRFDPPAGANHNIRPTSGRAHQDATAGTSIPAACGPRAGT